MSKKNTIMISLICLTIGVLMGLLWRPSAIRSDVRSAQMSTPSRPHLTELSVSPKVTDSSPDLIINHKYTAEIEGKRIEVPTVSTKNTATVTTHLDVTPVVRQLVPRWEVGVGVSSDRKPIASIQYNFKVNQGIECVVSKDRYAVLYKKRF